MPTDFASNLALRNRVMYFVADSVCCICVVLKLCSRQTASSGVIHAHLACKSWSASHPSPYVILIIRLTSEFEYALIKVNKLFFAYACFVLGSLIVG